MSAREAEAVSDADSDRVADLRARVEVLEEENRRLRAAYARVHRTRHRRTATGLAAVGLVALGGAAVFPSARVVLVTIGATGVFGALLTWYLTPERFVAAEVGERVYAALAGNEAAAVAELGLRDDRVYLPLEGDPDREAALFVPQAAEYAIPDASSLARTFVTGDDAARGLALEPTGSPLLAAAREALAGGLAADPSPLVDQLADAIAEQFELVEAVRSDVDPAEGRASLAVAGSAYGAVDRFDHPVGSLFAVGLAVGLDAPIRLEVDHTPDGRGDYLVTARWDGVGSAEPAADSG